MSNLVTRDARTQASIQPPVLEPFRMMRDLLRWDPFREWALAPEAGASFMPAFEVKETPSAYVIKADMPGIRLEDLEIQVLGTRVSISGKRESEVQEERETWHVVERGFGAFSRTFTVPEEINAAQVEARLDHGVLTLTVAKSPTAQPQKIQIQAGH